MGFRDQIQGWTDDAKDYFAQLSPQERYGWVAEGAGAVLLLLGLALLVF